MADSIRGIVTDIQRFSVHDGPGIRTLVFLKGCPPACPWCCNPETQEADPELLFYGFKCIGCGKCAATCRASAIGLSLKPRIDRERCTLCGECAKVRPSGALKMRGDPMTVDEVCSVTEKDRIFYDKSGGGVTFSGGEPLVQWKFLLAVLEKPGMEGIHTAVETTGYAPWETVEKFKGRVDLFLYDLKIVDDIVHRKTVGVSNKLVKENLRRLTSDGADVIVRVPVIPGYTQDGENIRSLFAFVFSLGKIKTVHLLPYHGYGKSKYKSVGRTYGLEDAVPTEREEMDSLAARAREFSLECVIGG